MAVNQVSLDLYPPDKKQIITYENSATVIDSIRILDSESIEIDPIIDFLEKKQFQSYNYRTNSVILERGKVNSLFGDEKEIQVNLYHEDKKLETIWIRFTLSSDSKKNIVFWNRLLEELCSKFALRVIDLDDNSWTRNFENLIKKNQNWKDLCEKGKFK